ncbi:hypothetical protein CR513_22651, partial [Mucuna pruriens]
MGLVCKYLYIRESTDHGIIKFKSLMEMRLSGCKLLKDVPDMSGAPNLKKRSLRVLPRELSLVSFPEILGKMANLRYLDLIDSDITDHGKLVGLTILNLNGCHQI